MPVICDICDKEFKSRRAMFAHRRWHDLPEYKEFQENVRKKLSGENNPMYGRHHSEEAKKKMGNNHFKGKHHTEETKKKISKAKKGRKRPDMSKNQIGDKNPAWKGDKAGYKAIHNWVSKYKPKPDLCELCGLPEFYENLGQFELSNITGKLIRDIDNFQWVHRRCHRKYDMENRFKNKNITKKLG